MSDYPYRAVATLKYRPPPAQGPSISFDKGAIVTVLGAADDDGDWLEGENDQGVRGVFPATFVQRADPDDESGAGTAQAGQGGEAVDSAAADDKVEQLSAPPPDAVQQGDKDVVPEAKTVEQAASSVTSPTSPPPVASAPPTAVEQPPASASTGPAKATPPPPAKKPNALAARIAAFNTTQQASSTPPVPRPKPVSKWSRPTESPAASASDPQAASSPPAPSAALDEPSQPGAADSKPKEFSAEDAKESIGRGGGSLRDRIKALQGLQIDQPAPPGRPPKPWKKKAEDPVVEEAEGASTETTAEKPADSTTGAITADETVVKDEEPKHDVERPAEDEKVPDIPGFEPAEPAAEEAEDTRPPRDEVTTLSDDTPQASEPSVDASEPTEPSGAKPKPSSIELLAATADSGPALMTPGSASLEVPSDPSPFIPSSDQPPISPPADARDAQTMEDEQDSEAAKRSAIAARMAGLGGQKMGGVPIPALPKRTAGPKRAPRGGAKSPAVAPASSAAAEGEGSPAASPGIEVEQRGVGDHAEKAEETAETTAPLEQPGAKEAEADIVSPVADEPRAGDTSVKDDVLASMVGASALLAADDDEDDDEKADPDDDDFDTPAPPPPPRRAAPPPAPQVDERPPLEDPELEEGEEQVDEEEFAQRRDTEETEPTIEEAAVDSLPTPATADPTIDEAKREGSDDVASAPRVPANRPPVPPAFVRQVTDEPASQDVDAHRFTAEVDNPAEGEPVATPTAPARPAHPPPLATANETIADEPRPHASGPDPTEESFTDLQRSPKPVSAVLAGLEPPKEGEEQKPPIPRHPAGPTKEKVTTNLEDKIMNEMEVVTPPVEAFDESTAAPELDAPSVLNLAEVRDSHPESTGLAEQALPPQGKAEGEATPLPVHSPGARTPEKPSDADEGGDEHEEEEEEEEEDPEVARRRAIAARMAKLGGMNMRMGPMIPPIGGIGAGPKQTKKPKEQEVEARDLNEQVVESQSSGTVTPDHPARRYGGIPVGGFALPGIAPPRRQATDDDQAKESEATSEIPEDPVEEERADQAVEPAAAVEAEEEPAPPPLPAGRPPSMPPRRSVPVPEPAQESQPDEAVPEHADEFVEEPEHHEPYGTEEEEMPPPPPPARPAGGHQGSLPPAGAPPLPPMAAVPSSPPSRAAPPPSHRDSTFSLGRSTTRSSRRSSTAPTTAANMGFASPRQSLDLAFDAERVQGGAIPQGAFLAKDVDLDAQSGTAWWRAPGGLPRSLQQRRDVAVEVTADGNDGSRCQKEVEVIYADLSKTVVSVSYEADDTAETSTALSQNHFAPPAKPSLDYLLQWSASLGAQVFAAAHAKASDKSARGLTDEQFVDACFQRATEPVPRIGTTYGAKVYEASVEGKKSATYAEDDEPRTGDVVVFRDVKLKQTLGSKTVGSHLAIVAGWDAKKAKLRVYEVDKGGAVDEGSYKLDDLKQGTITVYRVMARDFV
ncbi:hypothetical protein JCM10212_001549 [Sporobolomyces blumeae]